MTAKISNELKLPCGAVLKNRLAKGAMTEGLGDPDNKATKSHETLYTRWATGGTGMLLTGNIQVDRRYMERPGNVAIESPQSPEALSALRAFAEAGKKDGTHIWAQLSHAGRQTPALVNENPAGPSEIPLIMPGGQFGKPRKLSGEDILDVIQRFAFAAKTCKEVGFTGVQVHGAHGYLISEFLSPDVNNRTDEWGGSLENRARLLLETVRAVRAAVGPEFPVSVKLNSADFQKGGFSHEDSLQVAKWLNDEKIDLLEVSGGTYEAPRMGGMDDLNINPDRKETRSESTIAREAYFLEYARDIRAVTTMPLMVTGGFRSVEGMNAALASGQTDVIGVGRPLCVDPAISAKMLSGEVMQAPAFEQTLRIGPGWLSAQSPFMLMKGLNGWGQQGWFCLQIILMSKGKNPDLKLGVFKAFRLYQGNEKKASQQLNRSW
ncbi:MAG: NADH:flavin oxidoreductase/NADH oxidase family protein [Parvibaculaceae bacterium]|nr:NADH:flavin oxidoreductase/NADH oxidase family protein [Parvibaculaceae bacterium]